MPVSTTTDTGQLWLSILQGSGYRLTAPRRAIVEIMAACDRALSPFDLFELGRKSQPGLGLVTVYRTLEKMEELGLVQRVHLPGGCHTYLPAARGHQHLLLCQNCGRAVLFDGDELTSLFASVARKTGFTIRDHWLQLFGLCAECQ